MEREQRIKVLPEEGETLITVWPEREERLTTVETESAPSAAVYSGAYEAYPKTDTASQIFATADRLMVYDFTVHTIQTVETYNDQGGVTFEVLNGHQ